MQLSCFWSGFNYLHSWSPANAVWKDVLWGTWVHIPLHLMDHILCDARCLCHCTASHAIPISLPLMHSAHRMPSRAHWSVPEPRGALGFIASFCMEYLIQRFNLILPISTELGLDFAGPLQPPPKEVCCGFVMANWDEFRKASGLLEVLFRL